MRTFFTALVATLLIGIGVANAAPATHGYGMQHENQGNQFNFMEGGGG